MAFPPFNEANLSVATALRLPNPIPPTMWSYDAKIPDVPYDPEKAKTLLAAAGVLEWRRVRDGRALQASRVLGEKDPPPVAVDVRAEEDGDAEEDCVLLHNSLESFPRALVMWVYGRAAVAQIGDTDGFDECCDARYNQMLGEGRRRCPSEVKDPDECDHRQRIVLTDAYLVHGNHNINTARHIHEQVSSPSGQI